MRSRTPDRRCAEAVDLALSAAQCAAQPEPVGEYLGAEAEADRVVTHYFDCTGAAYRGWRWAVTVARASRSRHVTIDETVLVPGPDAVMAPEWVPWSERLRPGDLGPGDLLPTGADDPRLEPGYTGAEEPLADSAVAPRASDLADLADTEEITVETLTATSAGCIADVATEIGMARPRVLSRFGLEAAADRWESSYGPHTTIAQAAPAHCATCGFLVPIAGSLRQAFGLCANEYSPADGHVVSLAFGCGGHSEAAVMPTPPKPAKPVLDETYTEPLNLHD